MKVGVHQGVQLFMIPGFKSSVKDSVTQVMESNASMDVDANGHDCMKEALSTLPAQEVAPALTSLHSPSSASAAGSSLVGNPFMPPIADQLSVVSTSLEDGDLEELGLKVKRADNLIKIGLQHLMPMQNHSEDSNLYLLKNPTPPQGKTWEHKIVVFIWKAHTTEQQTNFSSKRVCLGSTSGNVCKVVPYRSSSGNDLKRCVLGAHLGIIYKDVSWEYLGIIESMPTQGDGQGTIQQTQGAPHVHGHHHLSQSQSDPIQVSRGCRKPFLHQAERRTQ